MSLGDRTSLTLMGVNFSVVLIIGILVTILFLVAIPTKTVHYTVEIPYSDTETYYEKEPYEVQEAYQEQEPYQTVETYTDIVPVPVSVAYQDVEYSYETYNAQSGYYYSSIPSGCVCSSNRYMYDASGTYGALCVQLTCAVPSLVTKYRTEMQQQSVQKERPVTKYQTVTKNRTVTKYRDVLKTREVLKIRNETQQVEVNWLVGYKTPYKLHLPIISGD